MSRATQGTDRVRHASRKGLSPSMAGLSRPFRSLVFVPCLRPTTPRRPEPPGFGLCRVRSPLLAVSLLFSLPPGTKMFQFPGFAPAQLVPGLQPGGLPHSGIRGSFRICRSPRLFAAYHALRRLREPQASAVRPFLVSLDLPVSIQGDGARSVLLYLAFLFYSSVQYVNDLFYVPTTRPSASSAVENKGLEPLTPCVQGRCSKPTELIPRSA